MKCLICLKADAVDGLTSAVFVCGEFRLTVSAVPARVCPSCGEAYVDEDVAAVLLHLAERELAQGFLEAELKFNER